MEPVYIFLLCLGIFVFTLILYPLILGLGGKTLQKKSEWENQVREIQELRTQWAVLQSAFKTKTEEEQNNILKIIQLLLCLCKLGERLEKSLITIGLCKVKAL